VVDQAFKSVDPKGKEDGVSFDHAGQRVKLVEAWDDGDYSTGAADRDRTTEWTYTADGQIATMTARNPNTGSQVTKYVYGTTTTESGVARSDLLRAVIYPDSDDVENPLGDGLWLGRGPDSEAHRPDVRGSRDARESHEL
jgi:hypothetical protein